MRFARPALAFLALLFGPALPGCQGVGDSSPSDVGTDGAEDGGPDREVRFDDEGPVSLVYRESRAFGLVVLEEGVPRAGVRVELGLEGDAQDSSLVETVLTTDGEGRAVGMLVAGTVSTTFWLRAALATGETGRVAVQTVAPREVRVTLEPLYDGARNVPQFEVRLLPDGACPAVYPGPADPTTEVVVTVEAAVPAFALDRALLFTDLRVLVVGLDAGRALTWGCVDGVRVPTAGLDRLPVAMTDLPWPPPGRHGIEVALPVGSIGARVVDEAFRPFAPLLEGGRGEGEFVVDGLIGALREAGDAAVAEVFETRRLADGLDDAVGLAVSGLGAALAGLRDGAAAFLRAAVFAGDVDLGETDDTGNGEAVERWRTIGDGTTALALAAAGEPAVEGVVRTTFASDRIALGSHDLPLSLGRVAALALSHAAGGADPDWEGRLADRLEVELPCAEVVAALTVSADLVAVCDAACLQAACERWRGGLAVASAAALADAELNYNTLNAVSSCVFLDDGGRLEPAGRCDGAIEAHWRGFADVALSGTWSVVPDPVP